MKQVDVIIIGAGAAGLMAAMTAAKRGRKVVVLDHSNKVGKKILMSGGGRCNFTNYDIQAENYISHNPHFCKSALSRFTQWDFIALVEKYQIAYHEKKLGQLFCDKKSKDILTMLLVECAEYNVKIIDHCSISRIEKINTGFLTKASCGQWQSQSLVIATGGLSIPKMGATGLGYEIAQQFKLKVLPRVAALVPFTLIESMKADFSELSGTSLEVIVNCNKQNFRENLLFTHRGLSGPAILQISSYWSQGNEIVINLLPDIDVNKLLDDNPKKQLTTVLCEYMSKKLSQKLCELWFKDTLGKSLAEISNPMKNAIVNKLTHWQIKPNGTEGYRTAEVTKGGIDTNELSSKTFESHKVKGLYFIGEVVDVTGHLGGYNFQWAWSSGYACGLYA